MARECTAKVSGHRSQKAAANCPACGQKASSKAAKLGGIKDQLSAYSTNFELQHPVQSKRDAQEYLSAGDMTEFLIKDLVPKWIEADSVKSIEWHMNDDQSGKITLVATKELDEEELQAISSWVSGQNSDGLGEGFEQQDFANYKDDSTLGGYNIDYGDEEEDDYEEEYWVMASFDWENNEYIFTKEVPDGLAAARSASK